MKTKHLLLLFSLVSFCFSCKKEVESIKTKSTSSNPTSYLLKRQTWSGPTTNGGGFSYFYNNENLVSRVERHQWGTFSVNGGPVQRWDDTTYYYFEYTNGLCTKMKVKGTTEDSYLAYEYNQQNQLVKRVSYSNNIAQSFSFYKYDNHGNLIEKTDSIYKVNFKFSFTYNSNNNLTSVINYDLQSNPVRKTKYEYLNHDNNVNFIRAVNGLPLTFEWDNNYHSYSSSSPNNYLASNYYPSVEINQPFGPSNYIQYSYKYNNEGLPTEMHYAGWLVTFEYEKYR